MVLLGIIGVADISERLVESKLLKWLQSGAASQCGDWHFAGT
jgi:hypothetical protein